MNVLFFLLGACFAVAALLLWARASSYRDAVRCQDDAHKALSERNEIGREQLHYLERIAVALEKGQQP